MTVSLGTSVLVCVCVNWASHPFVTHMHAPPAKGHLCGIASCPVSPRTWSPSPLWPMDDSSALGDTAKNKSFSCVHKRWLPGDSVKEPAWPHGPQPCPTFSLGLWALQVWSCGPYPSQVLTAPRCKAQAWCTGLSFHPHVSIWWLLLLLEPDPTEMLWIAVWARRLQPGRTFLLQLLDLHLGEKCSALHMNVPVSSVLEWELPSYSQCELTRSQKTCT